MELVDFRPDLASDWNALVDRARNGHFQWNRGFMDYHQDRFPDRSFLFREGSQVVGAVAGHPWGEDGWATHRGLTFGGLILGGEVRTPQVREMLNLLHGKLLERGVRRIRWRSQPWFHAREPSQEELYFLFRLEAKLVARTLGTILEPHRARLSDQRRRSCAKSKRDGLHLERRHDWESFWPLLTDRLEERHGVRAVHSLEEIRLLASRFPEQIRLYGAIQDGIWRAGMVVFATDEVFHIQYSASTPEGMRLGASSLLGFELSQEEARGRSRWVSFGNSCEQGGRLLNDGLVGFKEGFGGHGVVYDEYEYTPALLPADGL